MLCMELEVVVVIFRFCITLVNKQFSDQALQSVRRAAVLPTELIRVSSAVVNCCRSSSAFLPH